jgi:hypothetical protein
MEEIVSLMKDNLGLVVLIAFILGGGTVVPLMKRFAASTPNKVDDIIVQAFESLLESKRQAQEGITVTELDNRLSDRQLVELVRLRKARWADARKLAAGAG